MSRCIAFHNLEVWTWLNQIYPGWWWCAHGFVHAWRRGHLERKSYAYHYNNEEIGRYYARTHILEGLQKQHLTKNISTKIFYSFWREKKDFFFLKRNLTIQNDNWNFLAFTGFLKCFVYLGNSIHGKEDFFQALQFTSPKKNECKYIPKPWKRQRVKSNVI